MRDKQKEETRKRLYHAALEIFVRDGFSQCRIEDIAQKAEVSRAAFYFHFPSKDDVLLELLKESEEPLVDALHALAPDAPLQRVFDVFIEGMCAFWTNGSRGRLLVDVFSVSLRRTEVTTDREAEPVRAVVSRFFEAAARRGELSNVVPAEVLADFYLLNCLAAMSSWGAQPVMPLEDMLRGLTHLFMNGAHGAPHKD
ncbi:MAG: TetR/AcrR family transcriptional regulator [Myxococcota bacterium]